MVGFPEQGYAPWVETRVIYSKWLQEVLDPDWKKYLFGLFMINGDLHEIYR